MRLTERQRQIARLVALGHSNKRIASDLGISDRTVANHVFAIAQKIQGVGPPRRRIIAWYYRTRSAPLAGRM